MSLRSNTPRVTVIIPTRERPETLAKCLQTVLAQSYEPLEILVSDNHSEDATRDVVEQFEDDPRVRYLDTGRRLSMSENWEFALSNVAEENWVTILGDDDGLVPGAVDTFVEVARETGLRAVRSAVCSYTWPSLINARSGRLAVPLEKGLSVRHTSAWMARVLRGHAPYASLPMLYNGGFVHMSVLKELKAAGGAIYRSCIPDVYSAFAIGSVLDRYAFVAEPLAINGLSRHSTGLSLGRHSGDDSSGHKFRAEGNLPFHGAVPLNADGRPPMGQALVYESYLQSAFLRSCGPRTSHAEQLEIVLMMASDVAESEEWAVRFAALHRLDLPRARRRAHSRRWSWRARTGIERASRTARTFAVGSDDLPIRDVYEASIAAGIVKSMSPGSIANLGRLAARVWRGRRGSR